MPVELERKLRRQARKLKKQGKLHGDVDSYVYGTLNNMGAMHGNKVVTRNMAALKKHFRGKG